MGFIERLLCPGVYLSPWQDNHDCSRLILHDLIWQLKVKGKHVAMTPNRDTLIVTGSNDETGLAAMAKIAQAALDQPRLMSTIAFVLNDSTWTPFLPPANHPQHLTFKILQLQTYIRDYDEQKELLVKQLKKSGEDVFVASFKAMQEPQAGPAFSMCVWSQGVNTLLPRADRVVFMTVDGKKNAKTVGTVEWSRVQEVVGQLMKPYAEYPERYCVTEFPNENQFKEMMRGESHP